MSATKAETFFIIWSLCRRAQALKAASSLVCSLRWTWNMKGDGEKQHIWIQRAKNKVRRSWEKIQSKSSGEALSRGNKKVSRTWSVGSWDSCRKSRWWRKWDTGMRSRGIWRGEKAWEGLQACTHCAHWLLFSKIWNWASETRISVLLYCRENVSDPLGESKLHASQQPAIAINYFW